MAAKPRTVRQGLSEVVREVFDLPYLRDLAETIREMTKGYRVDFSCPKCAYRKIVTVQAPDTAAQLKAVTELIEQTEGRPGTASAESGDVILVVKGNWFADARDRDDVPAPGAAASVSLVKS